MLLRDLVCWHSEPLSEAVCCLLSQRRDGTWRVNSPHGYLTGMQIEPRGGWWGEASASTGEAMWQHHPLYLAALLNSRALHHFNSAAVDLREWHIPDIKFVTRHEVRLSMSLNAMRMSTEHFHGGSPRVMRLVRQRLDAGQRDVVHDLLVYLMQQVINTRADGRETRLLRAESLAAYLGVRQETLHTFLLQARPAAGSLTRFLLAGEAGPLRRQLDVAALVAAQLHQMRSSLGPIALRERTISRLIHSVADQLCHDAA